MGDPMKNYNYILLSILLLSGFNSQISAKFDLLLSLRHYFSKIFLKSEVKRRSELQKKIDNYAQYIYSDRQSGNLSLSLTGKAEDYFYLEQSNNPIFLAIMNKDYEFALEILPELIHFNMIPNIINEEFKFIIDWAGWYGAKPETFGLQYLLLRQKVDNPLRYQLIEKLIKYASKNELANYLAYPSNKVIEDIVWKAADCETIEDAYRKEYMSYEQSESSYTKMAREKILEKFTNKSNLYSKHCNFN